MNPDKIWSSVISLGDTFASRTGKKYTVTDIRDDGGFTITRASTDKAVRISGRMLGRMLTRIGDGESFAYQANATKGGISYTCVTCSPKTMPTDATSWEVPND